MENAFKSLKKNSLEHSKIPNSGFIPENHWELPPNPAQSWWFWDYFILFGNFLLYLGIFHLFFWNFLGFFLFGIFNLFLGGIFLRIFCSFLGGFFAFFGRIFWDFRFRIKSRIFPWNFPTLGPLNLSHFLELSSV